jgi:hypothetical protein
MTSLRSSIAIFASSLVVSAGMISYAVIAPRDAHAQTSPKTLAVSAGPSGAILSSSINNMVVYALNGGTYSVVLSGPAIAGAPMGLFCSIQQPTLEAALALRAAFNSANTTGIRCVDTSTSATLALKITTPPSSTQSFILFTSP